MAREQSNFPGLKDPRRQSALGRMADRDVELGHAREWSRERMAEARKRSDAAESQAYDGPAFTEGRGMTREQRGAKFKDAMERGITIGTGAPAIAASGLIPMGLRAGLLAQTPGALMVDAVNKDSESGGVNAALGGLAALGPAALPTALAALAAYPQDAEASKLQAMIDTGRKMFVASYSPQQVAKELARARGKLRRYDDEFAPVDVSRVVAAMNEGSNLFATRATPSSHVLTPLKAWHGMYEELHGPMPRQTQSVRDIRAETPGWHAAPLGMEDQVKHIAKRYIDEEGFAPKIGGVHARVNTPIYLPYDHLGEDPAALADYVGAGGALRKFMTSSDFDPTSRHLSKASQQSKFITDWLNSRGVDLGIYENDVERVRRGSASPNFPDMGNPSVTFFKQPKDFAKGGLARIAARMGSDAAPARRGVSNVIKEKGGNWLTGSVEEALGGLKSNVRSLPSNELPAAVRGEALNSFIDKQLTRYVKNEMATPEDPIRALAERGVLHFDPDPADANFSMRLGQAARNRELAGRDILATGNSPLALQWETLADSGIVPRRAEQIKDANLRAEMPWLEKLASETPVYGVDKTLAGDPLNWRHLIDELSNALNPESGLPRHLLLDPKSMDRVSVPQAVERVAAINKWREAQKAEADALRANNAATVLHKDYPDKGFKWVELRTKDSPDMLSPAQMEDHAASISALRDALRYEGDTMGHCVGGYCDDVASGRSRIYSLRDAKGQPHVTVEVRPNKRQAEYDAEVKRRFERAINDGSLMYTDLLDMAPKDSRQKLLDEALAHGDWALADLKGNRAADVEQDVFDYLLEHGVGRSTATKKLLPSLTEGLDQPPASIVQIKGKQNAAPNPEYLPFVQDFVRSGKWSDVGDLQNSGLLKHPSGYLTKDELGKLVDEGDLDAIRLWQQSYIDR